MREIIKSGTKYPFIENSQKFLLISGILVMGSLLLLMTKGLNRGIDFKGGNKLIVAFTEDTQVDADSIKEVIGGLISSKTGGDPGQIEVQGFDLGETDEKGRKVKKFQIYSELTTLLTDEAATKIEDAIKAALPVDTLERPAETDKFILRLKTTGVVSETKGKLLAVLNAQGFHKAHVVSEAERAMDMEFYKEYNLSLTERMKEGKEIPDDDYDREARAHEEKKNKTLAKRSDTQYTLELQQIQADVEAALFAKFSKDSVTVESATSVSPSVGADLFNKGMLAMIYAIFGILIYIGLRFDFRYSPGAVSP